MSALTAAADAYRAAVRDHTAAVQASSQAQRDYLAAGGRGSTRKWEKAIDEARRTRAARNRARDLLVAVALEIADAASHAERHDTGCAACRPVPGCDRPAGAPLDGSPLFFSPAANYTAGISGVDR